MAAPTITSLAFPPLPIIDTFYPSTSPSLDCPFTIQVPAGVTGYYFSETNVPPTSSSVWLSSPPPSFKFSKAKVYTDPPFETFNTLFAWVKNAAGEISQVAEADIWIATDCNSQKIQIVNNAVSIKKSDSAAMQFLWHTNIIGINIVKIGKTTAYEMTDYSSWTDPNGVSVDMRVGNMVMGTKYFYECFSVDPCGNFTGVSGSFVFGGSLVAVTPVDAGIYKGDSQILTASGADHYVWMVGTTVIGTGATITVLPTTGTEYICNGYDIMNVFIGSARSYIAIYNLPQVSLSVDKMTVVAGDEATITVTAVNQIGTQLALSKVAISPTTGLDGVSEYNNPTGFSGFTFKIKPTVTTTYTISALTQPPISGMVVKPGIAQVTISVSGVAPAPTLTVDPTQAAVPLHSYVNLKCSFSPDIDTLAIAHGNYPPIIYKGDVLKSGHFSISINPAASTIYNITATRGVAHTTVLSTITVI